MSYKNRSKNKNIGRNFLMTSVAIVVSIILVATAFSTVITAIDKSDNKLQHVAYDIVPQENKEGGLPGSSIVKQGQEAGSISYQSEGSDYSITFAIDVPPIEISEVLGEDGRTYQKIAIPGSPFLTEDIGSPQLPYLSKLVHIPDNAKDISVQVYSNSEPITYSGILVYPCPKSVIKTTDEGYDYIAEEFYINDAAYKSQHSIPEKRADIVEDSYLRSVRMIKVNFYPVTYVPASQTVEFVKTITVTVSWTVDENVQEERDTTRGFEKLLSQLALNYDVQAGAQPMSQSSSGGSVTFITGSQLLDTTITCDYLVITNESFFSSTELADFVNYRAAYSNLDAVVAQTSDIYAQFPNAGGDDYSIKDFILYAYDNWQTPPQYLLIVGDKEHIPSHQWTTPSPHRVIDDEEWYVCVDGVYDPWPDMAMGRFSVGNVNEIKNIHDKIVYYEQEQLYDKPFHKKALWTRGTCLPGLLEYEQLSNAGFNMTKLLSVYGDDGQDILEAINEGQDIIYYNGHGDQYKWEFNFNKFDLPDLENSVYPIVLTVACSTADLDYESIGECFVNIEDKGAVAYYGATADASGNPSHKIVAEIFDNAEYSLGMAILYGEFNWLTPYRTRIYILLGDPALQSFGYPPNTNLPDLTVSSIEVDYDYANQQLTLSVSNVGTSDAYDVPVDVVIVDEGTGENYLLGSHVFNVVPAGGAIQTVTLLDIAPPFTGEYSVVAIADPDNVIEESFELNNYNGRRMTVSPTFIDVTSGSGIGVPHSYDRRMIVKADINGDGYPDVYISGPGSALFLNNGDGTGTFTRVTSEAGVVLGTTSGAVFGDIDNDGDSDLYVCRLYGDRLFLNNGDGTFEDTTSSSGLHGYSSDEAIFGDVDNDGDLDLYIVKNEPPHNVLFINNGDRTFTDETNVRGLNDLNDGESASYPQFVDIDDDDDLDLFVVHILEDGYFFSPPTYYLNDGSGIFYPVMIIGDWSDHYPYLGLSISDIDLDGDLDFVAKGDRRPVKLMRQDYDGRFTCITDSHVVRRENLLGALVFAEMDNVPGEDIICAGCLIRNSKGGIFKNFEKGQYLPTSYSYVSCVLDFDRDGDNDLIGQKSGGIIVSQNQVNNQNWLQVRPVGTVSNRDAIGAKVYVYSNQGELIGFREVSSQRPAPLHFGLNGAETYDIVIQWPASEMWDVLEDVAPAQLITLLEGSTTPGIFANAHGPYYGLVNEPVQFIGSAYGGAPPYTTWQWDFGDGTNSTDKNPVHSYSEFNTYNVTLTVTDSEGNSSGDTTRVTMNQKITAEAHGSYSGTPGEPIYFKGSAEGGILPYTTWQWDFGDGTNSTEQNPTHTYSASGTYTHTVTLTVTDNQGHSDRDTATVIILDKSSVLNINKNMFYLSIQEAVDDADSNDTIYVGKGISYENVAINKPIHLIGEDKNMTVIDGSGSGIVVSIYANGVHISGFTVQNSGPDGYYDAGIAVRSSYNIISKNTITNNNRGIFISYNTVNNVISENIISYSRQGIYLIYSSYNTVSGNTIKKNIHGILVCLSVNNSILKNSITNNSYCGVYLMSSSYNTVSGNTIADNTQIGIRIIDGSSNNNICSENMIANNAYGVYIPQSPYSSPANNNWFYHNNFINNMQHAARDECTNIWYNATFNQGNYWDDHPEFVDKFSGPEQGEPGSDGICDMPYDIPGSGNIDLYPLMAPYPSVDLIITDFSAEISSVISPESLPELKLTATIKNIGTADTAARFWVSFYGTTENIGHNGIIIGTVKIPSLRAGDTANATIYWRPQPETHIISACADSTRIIEESNEINNCASITISYLLWNSLNETVDVYTRLSREYETHYAREVVRLAEEALLAGVFTNPQEYVETMKTIAELELEVGGELEGQVPSLLLEEYQDIVEHLIVVIDELMGGYISPDTAWEEAEGVAEIQLKVCDIVEQMLKK